MKEERDREDGDVVRGDGDVPVVRGDGDVVRGDPVSYHSSERMPP